MVSYQLNQKNERANNSHQMNSLWQPKVVMQETLPQTTEQTQGGVVPDPLEQRAEAPVPSVNERDLPNSNNQQKSPHKRMNDLLPKIEVLDDVMDISDNSDDSIPPLFYPKLDEEREPLLPKATKVSNRPIDTKDPTKPVSKPSYGLLSTSAALHVPTAVPFGIFIGLTSNTLISGEPLLRIAIIT